MPSLVKAGNLSDMTSVKEEGNLDRDSMTASMTTRMNLDTGGVYFTSELCFSCQNILHTI